MRTGAPFFVSIASGNSLSDAFNVGAAEFAGVFAPVVDSCQITVQQNWVSTSGDSNWMTTQNATIPNSGGTFVLNAGAPVGSAYCAIPANIVPPQFGRFKTSVSLTNPATFAILAKW